jgi:hypothetical protein
MALLLSGGAIEYRSMKISQSFRVNYGTNAVVLILAFFMKMRIVEALSRIKKKIEKIQNKNN